VRAAYAALFRRRVTVDFVHPSADLSRYRLLIAPTLHLVDDAAVDNIRAWVRRGGTLLVSFHSGIVDANDHVRLGGYPAPFADLLGLVVEEWAPYPVGQANIVRADGGTEFGCEAWSDVIRIEGAEVLATYRDDFYAGRAAVTQHAFGRGTGVYVGTQLDVAGMGWLMDRACGVAGVAVDTLTPRDVEVVRRTNGSQGWLFVLNHSTGQVQVRLDRPGLDVLSGALVDGSVTVGPGGVAIVRSFAAPG
jgi:beta-galactosidase